MTDSSLFRSEEMALIQFFVPTEVGRSALLALGDIGIVQFRDLNPETSPFQRNFVKELRWVDEIERRLKYFVEKIEVLGIRVRVNPEHYLTSTTPLASEIDQLDEKTVRWEERVRHLLDAKDSMQKRYSELIEKRHVLRETSVFFDHASVMQSTVRPSIDFSDSAPLLNTEIDAEAGIGAPRVNLQYASMNIGYVTGVIARQRVYGFERILWRALRGNLYMSTMDIEESVLDPETNQQLAKNVFIIFAHGKEVLAKVRKISESLGATLYHVDEDASTRRTAIVEVNSTINDLSSILGNMENTLYTELRLIAETLCYNMTLIKKEKAIYHTLNLFSYDQNQKILVGEGWVPRKSMQTVNAALKSAAPPSMPPIMTELPTNKVPPTYHCTNKFTSSFQSMIDAYGIATYREVNPGMMTIVTFPFLFAVMFGDLGHAIIMFLAALFLIFNERRLKNGNHNELFDMAFDGRYVILMMSLYAMFTGVIYNDLFSKAMSLFGTSRWVWPENHSGAEVRAMQKGIYPIGIDPGWHGADNALLFNNSYKMKLSVLLGVTHMLYSLSLSFLNHRYFKQSVEIYANFIPQLIFMLSIFGYLCFLIIYKWTVNWSLSEYAAPGLLNTLIYMFLSPGTIVEPLYRGQSTIQIFLLSAAAICVPWLLFMKPFVLWYEHSRSKGLGYQGVLGHGQVEDVSQVVNANDDDVYISGSLAADEGFQFGEIMIHQAIHTIEYCLGCISHTASYLRLWALSLAHNQLSVVLWTMTLGNAFKFSGITGVILMVIMFSVWFILTVVVLVIMEGTSAMLHSLRLTWVESCSKFYQADGYEFKPFSFATILDPKLNV